MACQQHWAAAVDLLKQGYLGSFFGGLGRVDLAMAAQEAAKFPDAERGLDQLLAKLPTQALQPPKLQAEPSVVNLGLVKIGQNRATELHLTNLGMRLLYGNVTSDCKWLTIGEAPGHPEKIFQFGADAVLPIQVLGKNLRAGSKPVEGHLVVDSNGGTTTVTFRADVPITPFQGGMFHGAVTPRQIAEKAKATPKDAAPFFENGAIAQWYASNGWNYPVQGPTMSSMGAIQQFFEALGVAKAPRVEFPVQSLDLQGSVGQTLHATIDVATSERKVVYGWATCDQTWVEIGKTKLDGKRASIPITVRIPSPAPPALEAKLNVTANGNQKTVVPLRVTIAGGKKGVSAQAEAPLPVEVINAARPLPVMVETMVPVQPANDNPFAVTDSPPAGGALPVLVLSGANAAPRSRQNKSGAAGFLFLLLPILLLCTCLLGLIVYDVVTVFWLRKAEINNNDGGGEAAAAFGKVDKDHPQIKVVFDEGNAGADYSDSMMFAVHKIDPQNSSGSSTKLNWYVNGLGNSVVVRIDDKDYTFGKPRFGFWKPQKAEDAGTYGGRKRTFEFRDIAVTQTVTLVPGDPEPVKGEYIRPINVCLARYDIHNLDKKHSHKVGLRVLLDTCIGNNDGAPFTLPGVPELVSKCQEFKSPNVPDFVQVLERPDLSNPGVVVQLNLRISAAFEMPSRFLLTYYPAGSRSAGKDKLDDWNVPLKDFDDDSSVAMYWDEQDLKPGGHRELAFSYGLGSVSITQRDRGKAKGSLGLTIGGAMYKGGDLTVVALVNDPEARTITLKLPAGLRAQDALQQTIPPQKKGRPVPVTWRVRADREGEHEIQVSTDTDLSQSRRATITLKSLFN